MLNTESIFRDLMPPLPVIRSVVYRDGVIIVDVRVLLASLGNLEVNVNVDKPFCDRPEFSGNLN